MKKRWLILLCIGLRTLSYSVWAQSEDDPLPRRGYFGVGLEKATNGARVFSVAPDSTAAAVGIVIGDVIEVVDGRPAATPEAVVASIGHHRSGESVKIDLSRDG